MKNYICSHKKGIQSIIGAEKDIVKSFNEILNEKTFESGLRFNQVINVNSSKTR